MPIYYRPEKRASRPWRAVVIDGHTRYEKWFETEAEAIKAEAYFLTQKGRNELPRCTIVEYGMVCGEIIKSRVAGMCNRHYLRYRRHGDPLYTRHKGRPKVEEATESLPAPCGRRIIPTPGPRRCREHLDCPVDGYLVCLDVAFKHNWQGWVAR